MQRIGLIGGITWGATAQYYRYLNLDVKRRLGGNHSAQLLINSLDLHPLLERADDVAGLEDIFHSAGCALQAGGAAVLAVASFTGHRYVQKLRTVSLPFVDLPAAVGARLRCERFDRVAVWATSFALADANLLGQLSGACGAQLVLPRAEQHAVLDGIVFGELADQVITPASLQILQTVLAQQIADGAQALLLATTDFAVVRGALRSAVPVLDATEIHCAALLDAAFA